MTERELKRSLFWRTCGWGTLVGILGGALYGLLIPGVGLPFGIFFSGIIGFVFGVINGQALSRVTLNEFYPLTDFASYRNASRSQSLLVSGFGIILIDGLFLYVAAIFGKLGPMELGLILMCPIVPALIASAATFWATRRVANWYRYKLDEIG